MEKNIRSYNVRWYECKAKRLQDTHCVKYTFDTTKRGCVGHEL